ncbi:hypothetical protein [Verrucomicrobium sp. BvORR106]|uniref:hypothetical protein n=1 Tax=Verrucomicrobium sp. BvORR106 TaxID=1403819 RepID=UPI002240FF07|nr:hypothetical protein [Verrucomicrobium sp. BvORR106]
MSPVANNSKPREYSSEACLVSDLEAIIRSGTGPVFCSSVVPEFDFVSGRTDLVGLNPDSTLHAFEAKLQKWKRALEQARRSRNFAHYSYVVLPQCAAQPALKARDEFVRQGVGLVIVVEKKARLEIVPKRKDPLMPWLTAKALTRLSDDGSKPHRSSRRSGP